MASGITSFPAFMVLALALCDFHKSCRMKLPCAAKCLQIMHAVLIPFRVCYDVVFSAFGTPKLCKAYLCPSFRTAFLTSTRFCLFALRFFAWLVIKHSTFAALNCERRCLDTTVMGRHAQSRASNTGNVITTASERPKLREIILLTGGQQFRKKYQFQDFKGKGRFTILVPCALQRWRMMNIAAKVLKMLVSAFPQVESTSNVRLARCNVNNAVDTRCVGGRSGIHASNCLSLAPCSCRLPEEQGYSLFAWGNYSHAMQPSSYYTILSAHPKSGSYMHIGHGR